MTVAYKLHITAQPSVSNSLITFICSNKSSSYPDACPVSVITYANQTRGAGLRTVFSRTLARPHSGSLPITMEIMEGRVCVFEPPAAWWLPAAAGRAVESARSNTEGPRPQTQPNTAGAARQAPSWHTAHLLTPPDPHTAWYVTTGPRQL